jgi:CheY-like chemotaxis protein
VKKKILLVDNVRSILDREKSMLNRENFQVFTATSGEEALEVHRHEKLDVIVVDLHMPGLPGDEMCRTIRSDPELKKVSILVATLSEDKADIERCVKAGANGHIKKPISKDDLCAKLSKLLDVPARQSIRILVRVKMDGKVGSEFFIANTVDVSSTGLLFESDKQFNVGDALEASFYLPGEGGFNRVVVRSEVMRVAPADGNNKRYGVRFVEFKEGNSEAITKYVAKKTGKA